MNQRTNDNAYTPISNKAPPAKLGLKNDSSYHILYNFQNSFESFLALQGLLNELDHITFYKEAYDIKS